MVIRRDCNRKPGQEIAVTFKTRLPLINITPEGQEIDVDYLSMIFMQWQYTVQVRKSK